MRYVPLNALVCCVLMSLYAHASIAADDQVIASVLTQARTHLSLIKSISMDTTTAYKVTTEGRNVFPAGLQADRVSKARFIGQGPRFRSEVTFKPDEAASNSEVFLYNGSTYQRWKPNSRQLVLTDNPFGVSPAMRFDSLVATYVFLFVGKAQVESERTWQKARDPRLWEQAVDSISEHQHKIHDGQEYEVMLFKLPASPLPESNGVPVPLNLRVYFKKALSYYPTKIAMEVADGTEIETTEISEYVEKQADGGTVVIPLRVLDVLYSQHKPIRSIETINNASNLQLNIDYPDDVFAIPLTMAKELTDTRVSEVPLRLSPPVVISEDLAQADQKVAQAPNIGRNYVFYAGGVCALCVGIGIWVQTSRRNRTARQSA